MQRQRRLSLTTPSASVVGGPARPPSPSLHRSTTTTSLATVRPPSSASSLHRTPSSHLLTSLVHPSSATTAVCTTLAPEAAVIRSPTSPTVGISAAALVRSSSRLGRSSSSTAAARSSSQARELPTRPIPISPTSPSTSHARRESALAAAIRHNDPSALRAERRRAEVVDSRLMHSRFGGVDDEALIVEASSDGDSGESFEVGVVDTGAAGLPTASRVARAPSSTRAAPGGLRSSSALAPQAPVQLRYSSGRRLSSLATYEGLPVPPALRGGASGATELELNYSLDALRSGAAAGEGGAGVRRGSSGGRRMSSSSAVRPPSPVPEGFRTSISPLTRSTLVGASIAAPPRRPSSPGPGMMGSSVRRGSSPARPVPSGVVGAASPALSSAGAFSTVESVRRAPSPARGAASGGNALASSASPGLRPARPASPSRGTAESASSPRVVRGFDPPGRAPSPARGAASLGAPALVRRGSFSASTTSPRPPHAHSHSTPATLAAPPQGETRYGASPATRPRSHLADSHADERLEVQASRDFAVIDDYYLSRRRARGDEQRAGGGGGRGEVGRSEARENRREAEERLRKGYDRAPQGIRPCAAWSKGGGGC
ncbi:uncharacterized protein JCM10292_006967 [Rhodotorula paludigena]|uniref:uncharacterized protein n=1 Tax=Rhodotorula paludigena TaxID=86838 RepID=UPI003173E437